MLIASYFLNGHQNIKLKVIMLNYIKENYFKDGLYTVYMYKKTGYLILLNFHCLSEATHSPL